MIIRLSSGEVIPVADPKEFHNKCTEYNTKLETLFEAGGFLTLEESVGNNFWNVDVVLQGGKMQYSSIADISMSLSNERQDYKYAFPSTFLNVNTQHASIDLAFHAVQALGLTDGLYSIEGTSDSRKGLQVLKVLPWPMYHSPISWQKEVWGVDFAELFYSAALGIPLFMAKPSSPLCHMRGMQIAVSRQGIFRGWQGLELAEKAPGFKRFSSFVETGKAIEGQPGRAVPLGILEVEGSSALEADANFSHISSLIDALIE
jgi:hypothetical protein